MAATAQAGALAGPRVATESLRGLLLWLMGFAGAFVFIEPGPYEFVALGAILLFAVTGLAMRAGVAPLILLLVMLNIGYGIALVQVIDQTKLVIWVLVSNFLALTAIFYAAVLGTNTQERLDWLLRGYIAAAVVAALIGVAAYFHALGASSELFVMFGRARATFNDPNVLGAFLILPALLLLRRVLVGRLSTVCGNGALLLVLLAALLLSFSRAAWGQFAFGAMLVTGMTFLTSRSRSERLRIVLIVVFAVLIAAVLLAVLLSIGQVAELFKQRASLEQSYDLGHLGRFGRYALGADLALDSPFGIGPLQFARIFFPEDPHNTFLNSFMSGGWLGGFAYLTLTLVTVVRGFQFIFKRTPWQPTYHVVYAAYLGCIGESAIVDIDHWRHYFLILGVLWGLMAVSRNYGRAAPRPDPIALAWPGTRRYSFGGGA